MNLPLDSGPMPATATCTSTTRASHRSAMRHGCSPAAPPTITGGCSNAWARTERSSSRRRSTAPTTARRSMRSPGSAATAPAASAVLHPDVDARNAAGARCRRNPWHPLHAVRSGDRGDPLRDGRAAGCAHRAVRLAHLQLHWRADQIVEHAAMLDRLPCRIVFDHFARFAAPARRLAPGFRGGRAAAAARRPQLGQARGTVISTNAASSTTAAPAAAARSRPPC